MGEHKQRQPPRRLEPLNRDGEIARKRGLAGEIDHRRNGEALHERPKQHGVGFERREILAIDP